MSKLAIRPSGMTLERALEIATAALPKPVTRTNLRDDVIRLYEANYSDGRIADELGVPRHKVGEIRRAAGLTSNHHLKSMSDTCPKGHKKTPENTYVDPRGYGRCRRCNNKRTN